MLLRPLGLERKQSGQGLRCTKVHFRWNEAGASVLSGTTGPFLPPAAGTLEALPRGALFLCLAELLGEPASGLADKGFVSIPVADKRPRLLPRSLATALILRRRGTDQHEHGRWSAITAV